MGCQTRQDLYIGDGMIDTPAERTIYMESPGALGPADFQGGQQIRIVLLFRQADGAGLFGHRPADGIEVADDRIRADAQGMCAVEAAIGGDDECVRRDRRTPAEIRAGRENDACRSRTVGVARLLASLAFLFHRAPFLICDQYSVVRSDRGT